MAIPVSSNLLGFQNTMVSITKHAKRSLLTSMDLQEQILTQAQARITDEQAKEVLEEIKKSIGTLKQRVHNDVSVIVPQACAAFEIIEKGGLAPIFGRDGEQMAAAKERK